MVRQERAERTRQRIVEAAAEVFDQSGFAGASVSEILARAGVTKGALYFHFPSKEAIAEEIQGAEVGTLESAATASGPFLQAIIDVSYAMASALRESPTVRASIRLAIESSFSEPSPGPYLASIDLVRTLLLRAQGEGSVRMDLDVDAAARFVISSFTGTQIVSQVFTRREDLEERLAELWAFILPGLAAPEWVGRLRLTAPERVPAG
ncbi:ScbR family autoregulator-binding transcription factor [Kitasatospora sp. NPDC085879]|uniref:ScbR family autoregulator-binding transcription factor n=1 Tax=Kitasatospora sp. NPDC085879 TaxID=3154769 RepID=UPI000BDBDA9F|nr:ScbR family autoregulator-binding transcription factor [Streptomyces sp. TLI_235]PBC76738.1 TetR family transcriptional regulator [Streptomyces sp. TLI_235]